MVKSLNVRLLVAGDCEEVSKPITILAPPFNYPSLFAPTQIAKTNKVREQSSNFGNLFHWIVCSAKIFLRILPFSFFPSCECCIQIFCRIPLPSLIEGSPSSPSSVIVQESCSDLSIPDIFTLSYIFLTFFTYFVFNKSRKSSIDSPASFLSDCTVKLF